MRAKEDIRVRPYAIVSVFVAVLTGLVHYFGLSFNLVNISLLYLFPVLLSAVRYGLGPSFYAAGIGLISFDFFFVPPIYSFSVADLRYLISFFVYLSVATLTASLAAKLRRQLLLAQQREVNTAALYKLSRQMTTVTELREVFDAISRQVFETTETQISVYLPNDAGELTAFKSCSESDAEADAAIASWVYAQAEMAGRGTQNLRDAPNMYVPLRTENDVHGVLAVHFGASSLSATPDRMRLVEAMGGLAALAIARIRLEEKAKIAHLTAESERLRTVLLDSLSHELRTPLAAIIGSVTGLMEEKNVYSEEDQLSLMATIHEGAMRMSRLVTNLLGMVKLESGMLRLHKNWCDMEDLIGVALSQVRESLQNRQVRIETEDNLPLFPGDDLLIEQVLVNVLSNAIKYSPNDTLIEVRSSTLGGFLTVQIADQGIGVPSSETARIFEKFYRLQTAAYVPGTGLGLAICKGIVEAHNGWIRADKNGEQGTVVTIAMPLAKDAPKLV